MAAVGGSNYWEGTAANFFVLFAFTWFAVTFITGVIMCKVKLKEFSAAFECM